MSPIRSQGTTAFLWDFFGKIARHGTLFIVMIVLARLLDPKDFGLIAIVMVFITLAFTFTDVGLSSALIQRRKVLPIHYASAFYFNIFLGSVFALITFFSAELLSEFYEEERLTLMLQVMSPIFLFTSFSSVQINKLRKELNYAVLSKAEVAAAVLSGGLSIVMAFNGAGVWSLVAQAISRSVFHNIFLWYMSKWKPIFSFSFKALGHLWKFGLNMFLTETLTVIFKRIDILVIGKLYSAATLGFYDQAKRLLELITQYASGSLMSVMFPVLSKVQKDLAQFQIIVTKTLGAISFIMFLLLGTMYLISDQLIILLLGEKWLPSIAYFKLLVLSGFHIPLSAVLANVVISRGDSKSFFLMEIYRIFLLLINFYVGFQWGMEGFLYGLVVVSTISVLINIYYASRECKIPFLNLLKPILFQMLIAIIVVLFVSWVLQSLDTYNIVLLAIKSVIFLALYILISKMFKTNPYIYVMEHVQPIYERKFKGIK